MIMMAKTLSTTSIPRNKAFLSCYNLRQLRLVYKGVEKKCTMIVDDEEFYITLMKERNYAQSRHRRRRQGRLLYYGEEAVQELTEGQKSKATR